jgi:putative ABC transport system ATP-binding protein
MSDNILKAKLLTKSYASKAGLVPALRSLSYDFPRGQMTAIMGPSGSGKSTLLQCMAGLDRPTSGNVFLGNTDLGTASTDDLSKIHRERIGFVFQAFNLLPMLTAGENIELPLQLAGRRASKKQILEALDQVGLADLAHRRPAELSGGQQQRVAIARALIVRPEVVFADEPTGALDTAASKQVLNLLRKAVDEFGLSVIMVTHDPVAASRADSTLFLVDGQLRGNLGKTTPEKIAAQLSTWEK